MKLEKKLCYYIIFIRERKNNKNDAGNYSSLRSLCDVLIYLYAFIVVLVKFGNAELVEERRKGS